MTRNDQLWYESLTVSERADFGKDGLSDYDMQCIDQIVGGRGDWFHAELVRLCAKADERNLGRLALGFPGTVAAVRSRMAFQPPVESEAAR